MSAEIILATGRGYGRYQRVACWDLITVTEVCFYYHLICELRTVFLSSNAEKLKVERRNQEQIKSFDRL